MNSILQFIKLVRNENIKTFLRLKTLIIVVLIVALAVVTGFVMKSTNKQPEDWKSGLQKQILSLETQNVKLQDKIMKGEGDKSEKEIDQMELKYNNNQLVVLKYAYDNNIPYNYYTNWKFVKSASWLTALIMLFIIIQAADSIPSEYSYGTIKQLLIRPHKRWKILLSKYISVIVQAVALYIFLFIITLIVGTIFFGIKGQSVDILMKNNLPQKISVLGYCAKVYLSDFIKLLVLIAMSFMISSIVKNSSASIALSFVVFFCGSIVTNFLTKYSFTKYLIFPNLDLKQFLPGETVALSGLTIQFSAAMLALYAAVFVAASFVVFTKRDIL